MMYPMPVIPPYAYHQALPYQPPPDYHPGYPPRSETVDPRIHEVVSSSSSVVRSVQRSKVSRPGARPPLKKSTTPAQLPDGNSFLKL